MTTDVKIPLFGMAEEYTTNDEFENPTLSNTSNVQAREI